MTNRNRMAGLLPVVLLALLLAGCGSGDPSAEESSSSGGDSASSSAPEATGEDYSGLVKTLFQEQAALQGATNADQANSKANFPDGVELGELNQSAQTLCIQDTNKDIAFTFASAKLVLQSGTCADGEEVAALTPKGKKDLEVSGDKSLAAPVRDFFMNPSSS